MHEIDRRDVLGLLSSTLLFSQVPNTAFAYSSTDLHEYAAAKAKSLADGKVKKLGLLMPNGSSANVLPVIGAFGQMSGIDVIPIETPVDDINVQLTLDALTGKGEYDVALPATFGLPDLVNAGAIQPLTDFVARHQPAGFQDGMLYQTGDSFDGEVYGYQTDGDAYVMFYNRDLLQDEDEQKRFEDSFGFPLDVPKTWSQLDAQIAHFDRPDDGLGGGLLFRTPNYVTWEWWVRFHAKGYWPLSKDLVPQIAREEGVLALEELIKVTEHLCPETSTLGLFGNWERFAKGDVYCNIGWGGTQKYLNGKHSNMRGRMVFGPTPGGVVDGHNIMTPYFNWGWNYVVTANAKHPEIAYLFSLFASSSEMSTLAVRQVDGYFDPFRREHYSDPEIRQAYSDAFLEVHAQSMQNAIPDLYLAGQGDYFRVLNDWITRALSREVSPELALRYVEENWNLISARAGIKQQTKRWANLRRKYPAAARSILRDYE